MKFLGLFEGYGIELEYMIVDKTTLAIRTITDEVLKSAAGAQVSDFIDGDITWSNELVLHVIELKTSGPAPTLAKLDASFARSLHRLQTLLAPHGACLLPTGMHPFMAPHEMKLWPHDNNEIYDAYDRIFGCKGHGWSNLQSMHINLPFRDDAEFTRLHAAIRFLLPLLPALAASSPVVEGKSTGASDSRLLFYEQNQARVPSVAGQVIPESVSSMDDYHRSVLKKIYADITPHDPDELLREDWLNSRGAIARFERQTIEIRVLDTQEAPLMDLAIADFTVAILKALIDMPETVRRRQADLSTVSLKSIFDACTHDAETALVKDPDYLEAWSSLVGKAPIGEAKGLLQAIFHSPAVTSRMSPAHVQSIATLLKIGSLGTRIRYVLGSTPTHAEITKVYTELAGCLKENRIFEPR